MITFQDVQNNGHQAQATLSKTDGVNGEKSLTGIIYFGQEVKDSIDKGWSLSFDGDDYVVVTIKRNDSDNTIAFTAVQAFFYKLSKTGFGETWNGSHTFTTYLDAIFKGTGYNYVNSATVAAFEKQNWGMKDRLSLFNDIVDQAGVEFYVKDKVVYIKPQIGTNLATVVRKGFNLADAEIQTDNSSFATYGRGFGAYSNPDDVTSPRLSVEYKSPLYDYYYPKFGAIEAQPVVDERYTITSNLLAAVKERVDKSWSVSLTLSLVDLQSAGYDYAMATAGDSITVIDEKLNFSEVVRIVKVVSDYNGEGDRINTQVTCGSLSFADQQKTSQATLANVAAGKSPIPNAWLTQQIQVATNDLLSARTELQFTDAGIIATDKSDANKVVLLNSSGLGVSVDGGQTFKTAITADQINGDNININNLNASSIIAGIIKGNNLSIDLDTGEVEFQHGKIRDALGNFEIDIDNGSLMSSNFGGSTVKVDNGTFRYYKTAKGVEVGQIGLNWGNIDGTPVEVMQHTTRIMATIQPISEEYSGILNGFDIWNGSAQFGVGLINAKGAPTNCENGFEASRSGVTAEAYEDATNQGASGVVTLRSYGKDLRYGGQLLLFPPDRQYNQAEYALSGSKSNIMGYPDGELALYSASKLSLSTDKTTVWGDFNVTGKKNAISVTRDGIRETPAYEMAESYFGDMGESKTDDSMSVKVPIEELFGDTVNTAIPYQVFLQSYSSAHVWVSSRDEAFFVIKSDQPNAPFAWELKAKRRGYESDRLVKSDVTYVKYGKAFGYDPDNNDAKKLLPAPTDNDLDTNVNEGSESDD